MVFSRDLRPANLDKGQEACRLRLYQLYAWGVPFVIATLAAVLDRIPPDQYVSLIRPKFGKHRCWFYGKYRTIIGLRTRRLPGRRCNFMHVFDIRLRFKYMYRRYLYSKSFRFLPMYLLAIFYEKFKSKKKLILCVKRT